MSLDGSFLRDEEFLCSICLDLFTKPVCTPCGHTFCMRCIGKYWDGTTVYQCPLCKKTFAKRPELQINRTLREITEHFKSLRAERVRTGAKDGHHRRTSQPPNHQNNLLNDLQKKLSKPLSRRPHRRRADPMERASSFPESERLQPDCAHVYSTSSPSDRSPLGSSPPSCSPPQRVSPVNSSPPPHLPPIYCPVPAPRNKSGGRPRRFTVIGAAETRNLPLCPAHNRAIMLYCQTDQMCICPECEEQEHPDHDVCSIEAQWREAKVQLASLEQEVEEIIKDRVAKLDQIRESKTKLEFSAQRQTALSLSLFSALASAVERAQSDLLEALDTKRRAAELQADTESRRIQLELDQLRTRMTRIQELRDTEDHIQGLKTFPSLSAMPLVSDGTGPPVTFELGVDTVYRSLSLQLQKFQDELKVIVERGFPDSDQDSSPALTQPRERGVQEYAADITLDQNTAHPRLFLSDDLKSVWYGERLQLLPDNPERFDRVVCVLGQQEICSGRHYWEVEVGGKTDWDLGVAKSSINRKGKLEVTPANGYWFLSLRDKKNYAFRTLPSTDVDLTQRPQKIGIFIDYDNGQVSFYNVDAKILIYTFNDLFHDSVFPFFSPCMSKNGKNEAPLIITPVCADD